VEGLRHIAGAAEKGARLTERLLAFARGSASPGSREPVRLDDIARDVIELARPSAPGNLELRLDVPPRIPMVDGNATSLGEAILNLLLNGIHACQEGSGTSVTLKIGHGDVDDGHLVGADTTAVLEVIDDGIGMSEAVRARVFEPLFTTRTEHGGTGLGCAVAYGVAVEHGGVLEVESTLGEGTVFSFVLPALGGQDVEATPMAPVSGSRSSAPEGPAVVDHMEQAREREPTGPRILAVDDEANVGQLMADLLGGAGFLVTIAHDGESALEVLAEDPDAYDLMILDVMMHSLEGGGLEVLARARELRPDLPVVFCTGHSNVEDVAIRELIATTPLLEKPFRAAALIEAVRDALAVD
jgi:CheY-like chemotaxis protein